MLAIAEERMDISPAHLLLLFLIALIEVPIAIWIGGRITRWVWPGRPNLRAVFRQGTGRGLAGCFVYLAAGESLLSIVLVVLRIAAGNLSTLL
jgi:hypothetical protein